MDEHAGGPPRMTHVPLKTLRTSFGSLRGCGSALPEQVHEPGPLPLRVLQSSDGSFEVLDGFKRLERWRASGVSQVPVVIEDISAGHEALAVLLTANAPRRTLTAMDEARVVSALRHEHGLGSTGIARLCGKKPGWVATRLTLAQRLSPAVARKVGEGTIGVTIAHALCALDGDEQDVVCTTIDRHRLTVRQGGALIAAYRVAESSQEKELLMKDPHRTVGPAKHDDSQQSRLAIYLEHKLIAMQETLKELARFSIPEERLTGPELRRLQACHRAVMGSLFDIAKDQARIVLGLAGNEEPHDDTPENTASTGRGDVRASIGPPPDHTGRGDVRASIGPPPDHIGTGCRCDHIQAVDTARQGADRSDQAPQADGLRHTEDCKENRAGAQGSAQRAQQAWTPAGLDHTQLVERALTHQQAGAVPQSYHGEGAQGSDDKPDPARDTHAGLHGRTHDPGRPPTLLESGLDTASTEGKEALRNQAGRRDTGGLVAL